MGKRTIVLGASPNPDRFSYKATQLLHKYNHEVIPIGIRSGMIGDIEIKDLSELPDKVHTISLYLNPTKQRDLYPFILSIRPKRIIFNPGTENAELVNIAIKHGITCEEACTLVLLETNQY
ncbi:MAG: CoA-binding protein [Bacteroidota bacterium]|nr:CoA-binding protein [Bacteroidota bacterium]